MSERMESVTVQSYLDVHRNEQRDHCQCVQCRIGRDLLDARKQIAEQERDHFERKIALETTIENQADALELERSQVEIERTAREKAEAWVKVFEEALQGVFDILCSFEEIEGAEKEIIAALAALRGEEQGK